MKKILVSLIIFCSVLSAQDNINVMSYYASDNSLDGQPRIDMTNILRFFPVYAVLEDVIEVYVIIYYGSEIYESYADKMSGGNYWQTLLPEFKLGGAVQRVEIKITFSLDSYYINKINKISEQIEEVKNESKRITNETQRQLVVTRNFVKENTKLSYSEAVNVFTRLLKTGRELSNYNKETIKTKLDSTFLFTPFICEKDKAYRDSLAGEFLAVISDKEKYSKLLSLIQTRIDTLKRHSELSAQIKKQKENLENVKEKISNEVYNEIFGEYTDSFFSGPAIRKSDLVISDDFKSAKLLYRYYKNNLRYRKALDPAENLGLFRARYVPFPVVGTPSDNKVQLLRPMQANAPVVFEVGLSFGDDVVSGDNTFNPAFSLSRLGVAIVITEKLFKADAEILGLALTYDFNSYASIGFGRNLAQGQSYPYFSFGINKKAFEQLLLGLAGLFN